MSLENEIRIGGVRCESEGTIRSGSLIGRGPQGAKGEKGDKGETGPQGPKGETGAQGPKGDTGATGPAGADGVSPTVSTSKSGKVTTITIKDATGTKTATINDGADGEKGDTGATGPQGPKGDTGDIGALTINGKKPDGSGAVTLTANDLGAATAEEVSQLKGDKLDKTGTAADSNKLGGKTLAEIMLTLYPVGAVYISANSTSPASLFGGTWESIVGRFLLGADATYAAGSTGGEATHELTISEIPKHSHNINASYSNIGSSSSVNGKLLAGDNNNGWLWEFASTGETGGNAAHNNMPPYLAVYMWKRVS